MSEPVALVGSDRGPRVDPDLPLAAAALRDAGCRVDLVRWDDADVDRTGYDLTVVRSCRDHARRLAEFLGGLPIGRTVRNRVDAGRLPGAGERVVELAVSAGSRGTARRADPSAALTHAVALTAAGRAATVQPYPAGVDDLGETAMLFTGGRFSHAVRQAPLRQRGEGVRQDRDSRGDLRPVEPTGARMATAQSVLDALGDVTPGAATPRQARIDLVSDDTGRPVLLEPTEPSVFLPQAPEAAAPSARAVEAEPQQ